MFRTSTLSGTTMTTPFGMAAVVRQAASGYALRALAHNERLTPLAGTQPFMVGRYSGSGEPTGLVRMSKPDGQLSLYTSKSQQGLT